MNRPSAGPPSVPEPDFLQLFGAPSIRCSASPEATALTWSKGAALLAYLACHAEWQSREALARLLRPADDAGAARAYLRRLIHRMRQALPAMSGLQLDDDRIRWAGGSDVRAFRAAMDRGDWDHAIALQPAPLLQGVDSAGLPALDDWIFEERARLRQSLRSALVGRIARGERGEGDHSELMRLLAQDDPLDEDGVQFLLAQARTPLERHAAAAAFDTLRRRLQSEWAQSPLPATVELHARLQAGAVAPPPSAAPAAVSPREIMEHRTPAAPLGRQGELDQLGSLLGRPDVRLLTIFGFGGVGKTVLARALLDHASAMGLPCAWVDLLAADGLHSMLDAIADQIGMPARDKSVEEHLSLWLAQHRLVIFLDNFEQLIAHAPVLGRLLERAAGARFVVTSREALRLPQEHAFRLEGLGCDGEDSPAARLFGLHAKRAGYQVAAGDGSAVARMMAHLQGLPLAIELAAHWTALLPPHGILAELEEDSGFLDGASTAQAGSTRTMQSVLAVVWRRLPPAEQAVLCCLSVFLGPVELEQARLVADADAPVLLRLVDKSLLQRSGPRGYRLHPLLRDFVRGRAPADVLAGANERHMQHFLGALAALPALHMGDAIPQEAQALAGQTEDLLKAWRFAVETGRTELLVEALPSLSVLLLAGSRHEETVRLCEQTAEHVPFEPLGALLAGLHATAAYRLGRLQEARCLAETALQRGAAGRARAWLELALARLNWFNSDYEAALAHSERAVAAVPPGDSDLRMMALLELGHSQYGIGLLEPARAGLEDCLQLARRHRARHWEGRALAYLGVVSSASRRPDQAIAYLDAAWHVFRELGAAYDLAFTLRCKSYAHFLDGHRELQLEAARAALETFRSAGYYHEQGESQFALALALQCCGQPARAQPVYLDALTSCLQANNVSGALRSMIMLGLSLGGELRSWGVAVACFALTHPGLRRPDRHELHGMLGRHGVTEEEIAQGGRDCAHWTLDDVCGRLIEHFAPRGTGPAPHGPEHP